MRKKKLKKNNFLKGAFVSTLGIVFSKILGILYVIPFFAIIGTSGGALYSYAYTIYLFFVSLSSAGIPLAISKVVSEYQTVGFYKAKKRSFDIGRKISIYMGFAIFLLLFLIAPLIAKSAVGNLSGGNSLEDVTFVIRVISTAILIVPLLSIYRGYFQGHRFMQESSLSQVLEQLVRVIVIIFGSFLLLKVFKMSLASAVGIAVFGATLGAFISYLYLFICKKNNNSRFNTKILDNNEPIISDKVILKKIIIYAIPFIMIDLFRSMYNYVDMVTLVKGLVEYSGYSMKTAESIFSIISTWCSKFNMILLAVSTGVVVSLIPNLTISFVKNETKKMSKQINQSFSLVLFLLIPMSIGISFLSKSIWTLFYGVDKFGPNILSIFIYVGLFMALFTVSVSIINVFRDLKVLFISLFAGILFKMIFNVKLLTTFIKLGLPAYYGSIFATMIGLFITFLICIITIHHKYGVNFDSLLKSIIDILCGSILMVIVLYLFKFIVPVYSKVRFMNLFIILFYSLLGIVVYFGYMLITKNYKNIFGNDLNKYLKIKK